jgi:hypothetical protein
VAGWKCEQDDLVRRDKAVRQWKHEVGVRGAATPCSLGSANDAAMYQSHVIVGRVPTIGGQNSVCINDNQSPAQMSSIIR